MNKPVYIFSGFLDSGKSQAIKGTLNNPNFNEGEFSLIIALEQGDVEYDEEFLKKSNSKVVYLDSVNDLTIEKQKELDKEYKPERIFIELNGMEDDNIIYNNGLISNWEIAQTLTIMDASKFGIYLTNMRQFFYNHVVNAEVVVLNRADDVDKRYIRNNIKSINQYTEIIYEDSNGNVSNRIDDDIFDLSKDLDVSDYDYGLWFMDAMDNPDKYDGKKVRIKVRYVDEIKEYNNVLIMGRRAMVCCAQDITDIALPCIGIKKKDIDKDKYYYVDGIAHMIRNEQGIKMCSLEVKSYEPAPAPEDELVSFN